ncbi:MAG TPA: phosphoribosyltransferase [Gemmatimonadales bacterium]|jgi:putative phosphoribosyl transferase|nr:phosphoribosyltransferase [Gemmatimonadales bacterium]
MRFADRRDAGRRLAQALERYRSAQPVVLGLPRGGVPVAAEVARALGAPLDVLVVRKLGAPGHPEFAVGAVAAGATVLHDDVVQQLGIPPEYLDRVIAQEQEELARRERAYRGSRPGVEVHGRTVILVDDGLATGATAEAAIRVLRAQGAGRIVLAVPVSAPDTLRRLTPLVDDLVCLSAPPGFRAVSLSYDDFSPTSDEEVLACLHERPAASAG